MESKAQAKILRTLEKEGYFFKTIKCNRNGVPDIVGCMPMEITEEMVGATIGVFCGLEVKGVRGRVSELQEAHVQSILKNGGRAGVVHNLDEARSILGPVE